MKFPFQPYKACPNRTSIKEVMAPSISDTLLLISRLILNVKKKNLTYSESVDQARQCQMAFVKIDH